MPRTVHATITTAIGRPVTEPGYLVHLGFPTAIRHSTRDTLSWNSYTWTGGRGTSVTRVSASAATIELQNADLSASSLVLNNALADIPCTIYQLYEGEATLVFTGFLDSATVGNRVTLNAKAFATARRVPNKYITHPTFNWLIAPGTKLTWANTHVTLPVNKPRRGRK